MRRFRRLPRVFCPGFDRRSAHVRSPEVSHHGSAVALLAGETAGAGEGSDGPVQDHFREPRWETIDDIEELIECTVTAWTPGFYTAGAVAGEEGERLRSLLAENANRAGEGDPD